VHAEEQEGHADARSPRGVVVVVERGERPEQRPDPAVAAIAVAPPATASGPAVLPPCKRRARGHAGPYGGTMQRCGVTIAAGECARIQRPAAPGKIHALRGERTARGE